MRNPNAQAALDRTIAPALLPIEHIQFIAPESSALANGVPLYWRNGLQNQTSKIELHFAAGSARLDPLNASLCAGLLINGSKGKTAKQIQKALANMTRNRTKLHSRILLPARHVRLTHLQSR